MAKKTSKNIAILGAGITGLTTAYTLSQSGHTITLFDPKGFPANNASAIAGGMLAPYSEIEHMPMDWITAGLNGIKFWQNFAQNHDIDFHNNGTLLLACPEDAHMLERFKSHLPSNLQSSNAQSPAELAQFKDTLTLPDEAHLDPTLTMAALITALKNCTLKTESANPEDLINTFDHIIDARGMNTPDTNLRGVKGEILLVRNTEFTLDRPIRLMHPRYPLYIVPRRDNIFMIGATIIESDCQENVSLRSAMELMSALYTIHRSFGEAEIISLTAGIRPAYENNLPQIKTEGNITTANGLFRHGYLLAPVIAEAITTHINGQTHDFMKLCTQAA